MTAATHDDQGGVTDISVEETSGKGSSTFHDWYLISDLTYDANGYVSGLGYMSSHEGFKTMVIFQNMAYDNQGRMISYTESISGSDSDLVNIITTRTDTEYNDLGMVVGYEEDVMTMVGTGQRQSMETVVTTYDYDMYGRVIGSRETIWSDDSPELVTSRNCVYDEYGRTEKFEQLYINRSTGYTLYLHYNGLGRVQEEIIIDHETGLATDVEDFLNALKKTGNFDGFTIVDNYIIITIIGILAVAFLPTILGAPAKGRDDHRISDVEKMGEDEGNRNENAYEKTIHLPTFNIYEDPDYADIARWLDEYLDDDDDDDDDIQKG
jgi:hypothetical protein